MLNVRWVIARLLLPLLVGVATAMGAARPAFQDVPPGLYTFRSFGADEGLKNVSVTAIAQDPEGFLWAGTEHGLFRLEGHRFRGYGEADGLPTSRISFGGLTPGARRGLWVLTTTGLVFWDGQHFRHPSDLGLTGLDNHTGVALNQGGVILSDFQHQTRYLSLDGEPFKALDGLPWGNGLTAGTYAAAQDLLVLALQKDLWIRSQGTWSHRDLAGSFMDSIQAIWVDGTGRIFLRSNEMLAVLADATAALEALPTPVPLSSINTVGLGMDGQGRLWTNTTTGILWVKEGRSGFIGEREGLPLGGADLLRVDRQGTLWIGGDAVHKLLGEGRWTGYTRHQGLPTDVVWSMARTRDGRIWAGTAGGLAVGDGRGFTVLPASRANQFLALEEDGDGNLWAGHTPSRERPTPLSVRAAGAALLTPVPLASLPLPGNVSAICADGDVLWLGTTSVGLLKARRQGSTLSGITRVPIPGWPKEAGINRVRKDASGGLWVGGGLGLAHWNGTTWATLDRKGGLPDDNVLCIVPLPGGEAWISFTDALALCRVRRQGDQVVLVRTLSAPNPLLQQPVVSLEMGPDGTLWVGSSGGLYRWDGTHMQRFGKDCGFPGEDCCQNALTFDAQGGLWVGLSVGLVHARFPSGRLDNEPPPAVLTEALRMDGQSLLASPAARKVPWKARTVAFSFCPFGTRATDGLAFQVRLVGLEGEWRETKLAEARYPGLNPGTYRFEVRTVTATGEVGAAQTLGFEILAPWWLRPWAWCLEALALGLAATLVLRWRTRLLRQRNTHLEALVAERTMALEEMSLSDPLTGLRNRRYIDLAVPEEALRAQRMFKELNAAGRDPRKEKEALVFFLLDLDHFKDVNDRWGHPAGDAILVQLADILRGATRASDNLIRWGGEEFLVVAKRTRQADAAVIAQNLLEAIRDNPFQLPDGERITLTCSLGLVGYPMHPSHPEAGSWRNAIEVADQCLYAAKRSGRNRWVAALVRPEAPMDPFAHLDAWDVPWAVEHGLMDAVSSEPDFTWPVGPASRRPETSGT